MAHDPNNPRGGANQVPGAQDEADRINARQAVAESLGSYLADPNSLEGESARRLLARADEMIQLGPEQAALAQEVVATGGFGGRPLARLLGKHSAGQFEDMDKRTQFLGTYLQSPEVAEAIAERGIAGFHGSSSGALWSILTSGGLLSARVAAERGIRLTTGEQTYTAAGQDCISFSDWRAPQTLWDYTRTETNGPLNREILQRLKQEADDHLLADQDISHDSPLYRSLVSRQAQIAGMLDKVTAAPDSVEARLICANFPVAFGLRIGEYTIDDNIRPAPSSSEAKNIRPAVPSDKAGEFWVMRPDVPLSDIGVIAVPADKVREVQELVSQFSPDIQVVPIEPLLQAA